MDRHPFLEAWKNLPIGTALFAAALAAMVAPANAGQPQSIRFDSLPILTVQGEEVSPGVAATSLLAVTLSSSDTSVVEVVDGRLRAKKAGWVRLTASQSGNAQFDPAADVSQLVWVANRPRKLTIWGGWDPPNASQKFQLPDSLRNDVVQVSAQMGTLAGVRQGGRMFVASAKSYFPGLESVGMPGLVKVRVTCGGNSLVAIRKDGSVVDYGEHRESYPSGAGGLVPDSLNRDIVDLLILQNYSIALRSDGTTFGIDNATRTAWQTPSVVGAGVTAMDVSCVGDDSRAQIGFLHADGSLVSWNRDSGLTRMPDSLKTSIRSIAAGWDYFLVVDKNGKAMEWSGTMKRGGWAVLPKSKLSSGVVHVAVDGDYGVAIKQDGSVVTWGDFGGNLPPPDSLVGGSMDVVASDVCGFAALGRLKPSLSFTAPAKVDWGDGDIEAGLVLQPGRIPVFASSNTQVAEFKEGRILIKHAGTTTLSVTYPPDSLWLESAPVERTLSVQPKRIMVQGKKQSKTFGDPDPVLTYTCTNCGAADVLTGSISRDSGEAAGTYTLQKGSLSASPDHEVVLLPEGFTIEPRRILVVADSVTKPVGAPDPALTYSASGLLPGDMLEGSLARDMGEDPGIYPIRQGSLDGKGNYVIEFQGSKFQIAPTSGLGTRWSRPKGDPTVHAKVRQPLMDRTQVGLGRTGLVPEADARRAQAVLDVLMPGAGRVDVAIFDNAGTPVCAWSGEITESQWRLLAPSGNGRRSLPMAWDLRSDAGMPVAAGVYLFKVSIRTDSGRRLEEIVRIGVR
ncbi:MAG TPA: MBG domain-containing protein [Fibrobacteria bacterium]|nr:MBG domain-containing protein [Fibrobacteria bacterium]HOX50640.1 MBG domain-containing protein [Fibrobacteria bacterium]